jgi:GNAT superfamily N-acetyltransferase
MSLSITVQPASYDDIDTMARLSDYAFEQDRHTQMKELGKVPYSQYEVMCQCLPIWLSSERHVVLKALDNSTGDVVGWCGWGFRGFEKADVPRVDPGKQEEVDKRTSGSENVKTEEKQVNVESQDIIARLEAMTDADMKRWTDNQMPHGTRCMYLVSLSVGPDFQSRGVGSRLLRWGTEMADKAGVFIWVHSSEAAWKTYEKHGFEVVETLDVNLDDWAPAPPPNEGDGAVWGHYVFRYMKRFPKQTLETLAF